MDTNARRGESKIRENCRLFFVIYSQIKLCGIVTTVRTNAWLKIIHCLWYIVTLQCTIRNMTWRFTYSTYRITCNFYDVKFLRFGLKWRHLFFADFLFCWLKISTEKMFILQEGTNEAMRDSFITFFINNWCTGQWFLEVKRIYNALENAEMLR